MSRLKRNLARRDKAWALLERSKERQLLNIEPTLVAILKDIPSRAFKETKTSPEWETLCYVASIATMHGLWDIEIQSVDQVIPHSRELDSFKNNWAIVKQKTPLSVSYFLNLIKKNDAV